LDASLRDRPKVETAVNYQSAIVCPSNLNLRRFRGDGPYFDGLTVVKGGPAFVSLRSRNGITGTVNQPITHKREHEPG
jgi:hypothetical protein